MVVSQPDYHGTGQSRSADGRVPLPGGGIAVASLGATRQASRNLSCLELFLDSAISPKHLCFRSLVFLVFAWILVGDWRKALPRVLTTVLVFLVVSGPWIMALSRAKGRFTFGDSGRSTMCSW